MIKLKIKDKRYKIFNSWDEITGQQAIEVDSYSMPDKLSKIMKGKPEIAETLTDQDMDEIRSYAKWVLAEFSNIPAEMIEHLPLDFVEGIFYENHYILCFELFTFQPTIKHGFISRFGLKFFNHLIIAGRVIPHYKLTIEEYQEASDMITDVNGLIMGMASYLVKGEKKILRKAERLKRGKMSKIWQLFFYTFPYLQKLEQDTKNFLAVEGMRMSLNLLASNPQFMRSLRPDWLEN